MKVENSNKKNTKIAIFTTDQEDKQIIKQSPTGITGGGTTLEVPIGIITRELTYEFFSQNYKNVTRINALDKSYSITISPKLTSFEYEYDQLSNVGFAITPKLSLSLTVKTYHKGSLISTKIYTNRAFIFNLCKKPISCCH